MKRIIGSSAIALMVALALGGCGGGGGGTPPPGTVAAPTFNPPAGTYDNTQNLAISTSTPGAEIRFTIDGSTPSSTSGTLYSDPIPISATTTVKAIAYLAGWNDSAVAEATFIIAVEAPTFSPPAGTYNGPQNVVISTGTPGAEIRYTTNGSTPSSTTGTLYSDPIPISATTTVKAIAYLAGWNDSAVVDAPYVIYYTVNAATGSDETGDGIDIPYKTITTALSHAAPGDNVTVAPGVYDNVLGEVFPIAVPAGVRLVGDEANKGNGPAPTVIRGGGGLPSDPGFISIAAYPGDNATIAGFTIHNNNADVSLNRGAIALNNSDAKTMNNRIVDVHAFGIYADASAPGRVISGNIIGNNVYGIIFKNGSGEGVRVENNVVTQNNRGIEYNAPAAYGDLGGGLTGSVGGNVIAANDNADVYSTLAATSTLYATNNYWDSSPPSGNDIVDVNGATIETEPSFVYQPAP